SDVQPRTERRRHPLSEVEVDVPGLEILRDVREMHVRSLPEVAVSPAVRQAECLQVGDARWAQPRLLRGRKAEEELGAIGDQVGAGHTGRDRHALREALPAREAAAREALADARRLE